MNWSGSNHTGRRSYRCGTSVRNGTCEGQIQADCLASHILDMDNIFEAFELMKCGRALRVVLKP